MTARKLLWRALGGTMLSAGTGPPPHGAVGVSQWVHMCACLYSATFCVAQKHHWEGLWTRWTSEVPSSLNYSVINNLQNKVTVLVLHDATTYEMVEIILLFELSWKIEKIFYLILLEMHLLNQARVAANTLNSSFCLNVGERISWMPDSRFSTSEAAFKCAGKDIHSHRISTKRTYLCI